MTAEIVYRLPALKGICVLAVILTHATTSIWRPFDWVLVPEVFANTLARFAVPLFIAVSGFYLSLNTRNERPLPFYRRTLPGLIRPFIVYSAVYVLVRNPDLGHLARTLPGHLMHGSASAHLWFIPVIVELYLLHPFLRKWYSRSGRSGLVVAIAAVLQVTYVAFYEVAVRPGPPVAGWEDLFVSSTSFLKFIGFFVAGYALRDGAPAVMEYVRRRGVFRAAAALWLLTGAILPVVWASQVFAGDPSRWAVSSRIALDLLTIPLSLAAFTMIIAPPPGWRVPPAIRWGTNVCGLYSYGIYYLHPLVLQLAGRVFHAYAGPLMTPGPQRGALLFLTGTVVTIAAVKVLARLPLTRRLA